MTVSKANASGARSKAQSGAQSNKAKIARRVIEVLDYFDDSHREATVMDIVRRYQRPQSSTSELLSSLVELGLLEKDAHARTYRLTPRAAMIGTGSQSGVVRDGRLVRLVDRLVAQTGLSVAVVGMVGLKAQIVSWRSGARGPVRGLHGGMLEALHESAAGWLLLSTIAQQRCDGVLRRLNAEAADDAKFSTDDMALRIQAARDTREAAGPAGFGSTAQLAAVLLPADASDVPLVVAFAFGPQDRVNPQALTACIHEAVRLELAPETSAPVTLELVQSAA